MARLSVEPDSFSTGHRRAMDAVRTELEVIGEEIIRRAVRYINRNNMNFDGDLRQITKEVEEVKSTIVRLVVGPTVEHGRYVYYGRKPGSWPPVGAMRRWVRKKLGIAERAEINSVAYLVGRKIAQEGIEEKREYLDEPLRQATQRLGRRLLKAYTDAF